MVSSLVWNSNTLYTAAGGTATRTGFKERGFGAAEREVIWSDIGGTGLRVYRDTRLTAKVYEVEIWINAASKAALDDEIAQWEGWHRSSLGEKVLQRTTAGGDVYQLDAVALTPVWDEQFGPHAIRVVQRYEAAFPFWRSATETSATGDFVGATPVNVAVANVGTEAAWARYTVTGTVTDPKVANSLGDYVEVAVVMTGADVLAVNCKPHATITYNAANYYGYRTAGSKFFQVPAGTTNVTLTAASGDATFVIYWYTYKESLT